MQIKICKNLYISFFKKIRIIQTLYLKIITNSLLFIKNSENNDLIIILQVQINFSKLYQYLKKSDMQVIDI